MVKIYSNQTLNKEEVDLFPNEVQTTDQDWWMIYDADTKEIVVKVQQCSGFTSSPFTMVIADTKEELDQYIINNNLIVATEEIVD
jgi:hypothetical protein